MGRSLSAWMDAKISQPEVKDLLLAAFRVATYTNAPDLMSAGAAIEQLKKALAKNVLYLDGGWQFKESKSRWSVLTGTAG